MLSRRFKPWHLVPFSLRYARLRLQRRPVLVHFDVTMRCNARCDFCDYWKTDAKAKETELKSFADAARHFRPMMITFTGGEPLLQLDGAAVDALHARGFTVAVETNGTCEPPRGLDWITVSPKAGAPLVLRRGDELKLVYPQPGAEPERYEQLDFTHYFVQPMDGPDREAATRAAVAWCQAHPRWRLSLQTHKALGIR